MSEEHKVAKMAAKITVTIAVGAFMTKAFIANAPATSKLHVAEIGGSLCGWVVGEKLEPYTDKIVDDIYARIAARKFQKTHTMK